MELILATLQFSNLLEIASLSAPGGDGYKRQEELIHIFRKREQPFLAIMPMRHRCHCKICGVESGESIYHFENPAVLCEEIAHQIMWGQAKGVWAQIKTTELHSVLAHDAKPNKQLMQVLNSVIY
ncbi:MAG: hypothetical protein P8179_02455 [Candidatus Thiodiazotropha sp.]|jgi:hypothetical protein